MDARVGQRSNGLLSRLSCLWNIPRLFQEILYPCLKCVNLDVRCALFVSVKTGLDVLRKRIKMIPTNQNGLSTVCNTQEFDSGLTCHRSFLFLNSALSSLKKIRIHRARDFFGSSVDFAVLHSSANVQK
ncbi:Uncharacterized protein XB15_01502 [Leptospira santarosai]|nr:Uncharacterized protein XB15_01502 [Leptospira santarosai]